MILSVTLSKPVTNVSDILGADYRRIKIRLMTASSAITKPEKNYFTEWYTEKQVFHKKMSAEELSLFLENHAGKTFRVCVEKTDNEEITILSNKKGKITTLRKPLNQIHPFTEAVPKPQGPLTDGLNRVKNYILAEGTPVPFLVHLGVMTPEGKVIAARYDKFRQVNRFLEYIDDIIDEITEHTHNRPLRITDFGCGKSYLTFAVYYFLTELRHIDVEITGLDLKKDVITYCNTLAEQFGYDKLHFAVGDIATFEQSAAPDMVITLHACDTATDYALAYAIKSKVYAILSVPCCQHELNLQLDSNRMNQKDTTDSPIIPLLKFGIIRERFAALATDALRAEYLENAGYRVQILEFIDMSHTPKNLLIRAVRKNESMSDKKNTAEDEAKRLTDILHVSPTLHKLLKD